MADKMIVTIGREFGTGGRKIANELAELLGIKVYDRKLLTQLEERYSLTAEEIDKIKSHKKSWWEDFNLFYSHTRRWKETENGLEEEIVNSERLYADEKEILQALAAEESCIILGRTGFHIFKDDPRAFKVFLIADITTRRDKVARRLNINEGSADLLIKKVDEARENFALTFSEKSRYDVHNYDLVLNVSNMDPKVVAQTIAICAKNKLKIAVSNQIA